MLVTRLSLVEELRPLTDDLLDLLAGLGALGVAALASVLVWAGSGVVNMASPPTSAAFTAVVTFALAVPGAVWVRRSVLNRRYGNGVISPSDVAAITADLNARTDPRDLLDKAARMVATASGTRDARIVLGGDEPDVPPGWVEDELLVGGDRVGALLVDAGGPEGLEPRQARVVSQLLPTVGLVTRAVGLAIEAEHARFDVARERDAERARILGDLHDGLGPALAGMSMRVQASLRSAPAPEHASLLADLADGLAASRTDLRRIVSGLTPSALDDGDLDAALRALVSSFRGQHDGPSLSLETSLPGALDQEVQVAIYRCVAEGVTNALRHASATSISVRVVRTGSCVGVDVVDDGAGGRVVPGVGLSSLAARAEAGGGRLDVAPDASEGHPAAPRAARGVPRHDHRGADRRRPPGGAHGTGGADRLRLRHCRSSVRRGPAPRPASSPTTSCPTWPSWTCSCPTETGSRSGPSSSCAGPGCAF